MGGGCVTQVLASPLSNSQFMQGGSSSSMMAAQGGGVLASPLPPQQTIQQVVVIAVVVAVVVVVLVGLRRYACKLPMQLRQAVGEGYHRECRKVGWPGR